MTIFQEIKDSFKRGSVITRLIYVNIASFVLLRLIEVVSYLIGTPISFIDFFALPAYSGALLHKPWTIITYMFMHNGMLHLLFNMLWLYWMGELFLRYFTQNQLLGIYFLGGLAGAFSYILLFNISPTLGEKLHIVQLVGASASILAIVAAVATYVPNHPIRLMFIGEIKMKHLAIISIVIYALGMSGTNAGGNIAHVGGMLLGFVFIVLLRKGNDLTRWVPTAVYWLEKVFKSNPKVRVSYKNANYKQNKPKQTEQVRINDILEKIRKSGYDSLSKEEKELLFRMGKN